MMRIIKRLHDSFARADAYMRIITLLFIVMFAGSLFFSEIREFVIINILWGAFTFTAPAIILLFYGIVCFQIKKSKLNLSLSSDIGNISMNLTSDKRRVSSKFDDGFDIKELSEE